MQSKSLGEESIQSPRPNVVPDPNTDIRLCVNHIQDLPKDIGG